ncbi:MAG: allantoinase [Actinobacteria bacterium 13_1_20CM_2_65_11]|nr:MAG: allantoinase [Actinobacteria bacterium 13_1_20CM_2_65_11]
MVIIRGGAVVTARGVDESDIEIADGRIIAVGANLGGAAADEIDATGLHIFPGGIDSHVHFNEPGRSEWETIANGSAALAAGGYTTFVDMPLNNLPVTTDAGAFELKLDAAARSSHVDFGFWGGLIPGNLEHLDELAKRGVSGFKAFMCPSGIDEFPACDAEVLRAGMERIAELGSILLVHAEDPSRLDSPNGQTARDFIWSRPADAELEAITLAIGLAGDTGCRLHVVHVSTARGAELIDEAHQRGVDVSGETCPHYLLYVEDDMERLGGIAKCAPPFRTALDRERLWWMLRDGRLPMVVSDHSPSTLELKQGDDFSKLWGGISGCQSTRQLLLANNQKDRLELPVIAAATSTNVAKRFRLAGKGDIAPGYDADLSLVDLSYEGVVRREDLLYRNPFSAHEGRPIRGRTVRTLVRGRTVFVDGQVDRTSRGRFVRPE